MKKFKFILFTLVLFLFSTSALQASTVKAPIISDLNPGIKSFNEPFVSGFTEHNTSVLLYMDGDYYSNAEIVKGEKADIFYFYFDSLPSETKHSFFLIARDINGLMSPQTKSKEFVVIHSLDTPKILEKSFSPSIFLSGQVSNETFLDVFIDNALYKTIYTKRNGKNFFNFDDKTLASGEHSIFLQARDEIGRISKKTETLFFNFENKELTLKKTPKKKFVESNIKNGNKAILSKTAETEGILVAGINNISKSSKKETNIKDNSELDKILADINKEEKNKSGATNESGGGQVDLKLNLLIFLGFLLAVILWIVWVNREINENKEKGENILKE